MLWGFIQYGFLLYSTSFTHNIMSYQLSSNSEHHSKRYQRRYSNPIHILDQLNELKIENALVGENIFLVSMPQPTGLFFAQNPSILVPEVIDSFRELLNVDLNQFMNDHVCVLQHNCVDINHLYRSVHQIPKVLSKNQCLEIIMKAEQFASVHGG